MPLPGNKARGGGGSESGQKLWQAAWGFQPHGQRGGQGARNTERGGRVGISPSVEQEDKSNAHFPREHHVLLLLRAL